MPRMQRPKAEHAVKKKIEPVLKGEDPDGKVNLHRTSDIHYLLERLIGESVSKSLISDVFNMLFLPGPRIKEKYEHENMDHYEAMQNLLSELGDMPLRKETAGNMDKSTAAAVNIIAKLIDSMKQMQKNTSNTDQAAAGANLLDKWLDGQNGQAEQLQQMQQAMGNANAGGLPSPGLQEQINKRSRQAAKDAGDSKESLEEMEDRASQQGHDPGTLEFGGRDMRAEELARDMAIRRLLDAINGPKGVSSYSQDKTRFNRGEYRGYKLGDDLSAIAPPAYIYPKEMIMALYAQKKLPQYDHQVHRTVKNKYVLFDKSGSVTGNRLTFAKAVARALYDDSLRRGSKFTLTYFDAVTYGAVEVLKNAKREVKEAMKDYIEMVKPIGGTEIMEAIKAACSDIYQSKTKEATQIILITDGESAINEPQAKAMLNYVNAELIVIYINHVLSPMYVEPLMDVATHFFAVDTTMPEVVLEAKKSPARR